MKRIGITVWPWMFCLLALLTTLAAAPALAQPNPDGVKGEEYQLCSSLGSGADAEDLAAGIREAVAGVEVRIVPRTVGDRQINDIFVRHPQLTPRELCRELGRASCRGAQKGCSEKNAQ